MVVLNLVDASNYENTCGVLVCENEKITRKDIQEKINEIKGDFDLEGMDWMIGDVISGIPDEWKVKYYSGDDSIKI